MSVSPAVAHLGVPDEPGRPVVVLHSWWGMTASFTDFADRLAGRGLLAGCVDLYGGRLASTPEEARALRSTPRREPMYRSMIRALDELRDHPAADGRAPGLVGFSMGGHWAVWLAQRADVGAEAVVVYYATRAIAGGGPVPVLAHFAEVDPFVSAAGRRTMERSLAKHGWPYRAVDHPGTRHWFAESTDDNYAVEAAEAAFEDTVTHLA